MKKNTTSLSELMRELRKNEEFVKAEQKVAPYYDLAREIISSRLANKLTQKELAEKAGTHQGRISKIESGEQDVRYSTLVQIASALNCQVKTMFIPYEKYIQSDEPYIQLFEANAQLKGNSTFDISNNEKQYGK